MIKSLREFEKPGSRSLLKPINGFMKLVNESGISGGETTWLFYIHIFIKITMQKCVVNIYLMNGPLV